MVGEPVEHVRAVAPALRAAGATLVAGHSAHVFHGVHGAVLYDLGDFLDDYRVTRAAQRPRAAVARRARRARPVARRGRPARPRLLPHAPAAGSEIDLVASLLSARCAAVGSRVVREGDGW